jgi:hypothetical protein
VLSWTNPSAATNWDRVDQIRFSFLDTRCNSVGKARTINTNQTVTLPAALIQVMKDTGDGTLAKWRIQTRAYNSLPTTNLQYARGYSNKVVLP